MAKDLHDIREEAQQRLAEALARTVGDAAAAARAIGPILAEYNPPDDVDPAVCRLVVHANEGKLRFEEPASGDYADLVTHPNGHWWFEDEAEVTDYDDVHEQVAYGVLRLVPWGNEDDIARMIALTSDAGSEDSSES